MPDETWVCADCKRRLAVEKDKAYLKMTYFGDDYTYFVVCKICIQKNVVKPLKKERG